MDSHDVVEASYYLVVSSIQAVFAFAFAVFSEQVVAFASFVRHYDHTLLALVKTVHLP